MTTTQRLRALLVITKLKDIAIPFFCVLALSTTALKIYPPPESISTAFGDPTIAWLWATLCFISYIAIVLGVLLKKSNLKQQEDDIKNSNKGIDRGDLYLYFEYPGLIAASIFTNVYAAAIMARFGFTSFIAIGFTLAIGSYFFLRWLILWVSLSIAKKKNTIQKGS